MAGKLTARDRGHALANKLEAVCAYHEVLGWSHGWRCDVATKAFQAHEDAVREEAARAVDAYEDDYRCDGFHQIADACIRIARALRTRVATKDGQR